MSENKLKKMLKDVEEFYQPENPSLKDGIGHEIEHIKGVIRRSDEIRNITEELSNNPINAGLTATVAVLHDIGNAISRKFHNDIGLGIIKGELEVTDILKVPRVISINSKNTWIDENNRRNINNYIKENGYDFTPEKLSRLDEIERTAMTDAFYEKIVFEVGYNGIRPEEFSKWIENYHLDNVTLQEYSKNIFEDESHTKYKGVIIEAAEDLRKLTESIQEVYPKGSEELDIIAEAVQDHNIDFTYDPEKKEKTRYEARSIYGMIVADADKDNCPETFAVRTIMFAVNKWAKENNWFRLPNVNIDHCLAHVMHQANERFRFAFNGDDPSKVTKMFDDVFFYKKIRDVKILTEVDGKDDPRAEGKQVFSVPFITKSGMKTIDAGKKYVITNAPGTDIYSQIDNKFGVDKVIGLRDDFFKKIQKWAEPGNEKKAMKDVQKIYKVIERSGSIEEAVDKYEKKYWKKHSQSHIKSNSFRDIIDALAFFTRPKRGPSYPTLNGPFRPTLTLKKKLQ